jgi:hypothetical protein
VIVLVSSPGFTACIQLLGFTERAPFAPTGACASRLTAAILPVVERHATQSTFGYAPLVSTARETSHALEHSCVRTWRPTCFSANESFGGPPTGQISAYGPDARALPVDQDGRGPSVHDGGSESNREERRTHEHAGESEGRVGRPSQGDQVNPGLLQHGIAGANRQLLSALRAQLFAIWPGSARGAAELGIETLD